MCQMSAYVVESTGEKLLQENVTRLEVKKGRVYLSSLFEGTSEMESVVLDHIDFSAGRLVFKHGDGGESE